jgi:hypothetical protein
MVDYTDTNIPLINHPALPTHDSEKEEGIKKVTEVEENV